MAARQKIDTNFTTRHDALEDEFFGVVAEGTPEQHRELKSGKSLDDFNQRHRANAKGHEAELLAAGYLTVPEPPRDLETEIDELRAEIEGLRSPNR